MRHLILSAVAAGLLAAPAAVAQERRSQDSLAGLITFKSPSQNIGCALERRLREVRHQPARLVTAAQARELRRRLRAGPDDLAQRQPRTLRVRR